MANQEPIAHTGEIQDALRNLEYVLPKALVLTFGFDDCDPCGSWLVKDKAAADRIAREWFKDYLESGDHGDDEEAIEDSFGWSTFPMALIFTDDKALEDLARDLVNDCRRADLASFAAGEDDSVVIP